MARMNKEYRERMIKKDADAERVYRVFEKLQFAILKAERGDISFAQVFDDIPIRDCLKQHTIMATTWHIDDIRDLTADMSDDELFFELQQMEKTIHESAVANGWEIIDLLMSGKTTDG